MAKQEQNGGDQGSGMTDTDPENEVGDVPGPADRSVVAPDAHAGEELVAQHADHHQENGKRDREADIPVAVDSAFDDLADLIGDFVIGKIPLHQSRIELLGERFRDRGQSCGGCHLRHILRFVPSLSLQFRIRIP